MNVSLQLANAYSNIDLLAIPTEEIVSRIGAQLGAIESITSLRDVYTGAVVARVVSCEKHPNADKLNVCLIDDGKATPDVARNDDGLVQVVCGAPNVRAGLNVVWLPPGATVPSTATKDPFVLGARELRGVVSNGMLASAHELAISEDHDGILELTDANARPGTPFVQLFGLDDVVIDCENKKFTHRPDCFGVLGVARELAGICGQAFKSPDWYSLQNIQVTAGSGSLAVSSSNDITDKVPRFMVQVVEGVTVQPSEAQMQSWLSRLGSRPINNIVDATNFYMHLTAQPTHTFDYDKVKALCSGDVQIFPRMAHEGEKLELLNGKTITLTTADIVIATDQQAIALGGVMGGLATEVDQKTKNIIIECANFDMYTIRRTSMRHGLFSDAVTRFNKGQSHLQNPVVLAKLVEDICNQTGATAGMLYDSAPEETRFSWEPVLVPVDFVNARLGSDLNADTMQQLLTSVEFAVEQTPEGLVVTPPFWRKDIDIAEDVIEEIGRLYGYDKLAVVLPKRSSAPVTKNTILEFKTRLRGTLAKVGANEVMSYSFVSGKLIEDVSQNTDEAYKLSNALSPELQYYRLSITPSLLARVHGNIRAGHDAFALFEMGKAHLKGQGVDDEGLPLENDMLAVVVAHNDKRLAKGAGATYFEAKNYVEHIAHTLGMAFDYDVLTAEPEHEIAKPYDWQRSALITDRNTGNYIGIVGEFKASVRKKLKLPVHSAGCELMLAPLMDGAEALLLYRPLSRFPHITQDVTFKTPKEQAWGDVNEQLNEQLVARASDHGYVTTVEPHDIYHKEHSPQKHITLRIDVHHPDRTLTTEEVNSLVAGAVGEVEKHLDIKRV